RHHARNALRLPRPPATPSAVATRNDLAAIVATNNNYLATRGQITFRALSTAPGAGNRSAGTFIGQKQPNIPVCKAIEDVTDSLYLLLDPQPQVFNNTELDQAFA